MSRVVRRGVPASAIAITAFFALVVLPRPAIPLIDGDVYWHIHAGQIVLTTGSVPRLDTWSIVGSGMKWTSQDWLSNVALAAAWNLGELGPTVASFVWALLVVVAFAFLWWAIGKRRSESGWLGRIVWLAAGLIVAGPTLGVRVQVVDLTMGAATLAVLWAYLATRRRRWLIWLPLITLAWVNLHAGWLLLFLLGGAVVVGEGVDRRLQRRLPTAGAPMAWRDLGWLAVALAACIPVIALNPNGPDLYLYPFRTSSIAAHRDFVSEWRPPDVASFPGQVFLAFSLILVLPFLWFARRSIRLADALIVLGLTFMTATAARFLIVAPLTAAAILLHAEPVISSTRFGRAFGPLLRRLATPRPRLSALNAVMVALVILMGVAVTWTRTSPQAQRAMIADNMPVGAVDWILTHNPGDRPFNQYSWGGYLGLRRPDHPIYIDGRSDVYGDAPIRRYAETVLLKLDPESIFDSDRIEYVLFGVGTPLARWLDGSAQWRRVYADEIAGVWVRR